MSGEQVIFAIAAATCIGGAFVAVTHRDPRAAAAALMATLVALAVIYAGLVAPVVAGIALIVALFAIIPLVVHFTVTAPHGYRREAGPSVAGAAVVLSGALLVLLGVAVTFGELPLNVSVRSSDGYDLADTFRNYYNQHRPHRALGGRTPLVAFKARLRARPAATAAAVHFRVRHDRVDTNGTVTLRYHSRLRHIAIGRVHKYERVRLLIADDLVRVIREDGSLIRERTLDPGCDYQSLALSSMS